MALGFPTAIAHEKSTCLFFCDFVAFRKTASGYFRLKVVRFVKRLSMKNFFALFLMLALAACSKTIAPEPPQNTAPGPYTLQKKVVLTGLQTPWGMDFIDDQTLLIAEKEGQILLANLQTGTSQQIFTVPNVAVFGQGGLLDLRLHPQFSQNKWVYFSYVKRNGNQYTTALGRAQYANAAFSNFEEIFVADAWATTGVHFGSRICFDHQGHLYLSLGDRGQMAEAQNLTNHKGTLLRLNADGTVPADNPFVGDPLAKPEIWTYGNRNIQGLALHPTTGAVWGHEHGPQGGDEINIHTKGANHGWPLVSFGRNYNGTPVSGDTALPGLVPPVHYYTPSIAPCGMAFLKSEPYPNMDGYLAIGALVLQHLNISKIAQDAVTAEGRYFVSQGRIRNVAVAPDGYLYFANESNGTLYQLYPEFED